jgi:RimJ/RimL family protein N-acetyltransferase
MQNVTSHPRVFWQQHRPARRLVTLRDGRRVLLRPLRPEDRELYLRGFEHLSAHSRYMRFFSPKLRLSETEIRYFVEVDHHAHEAIAAIDLVSGEGIGVARYVRDGEAGAAEVSITVVDEFQGQGLGEVLLLFVAERAAEEGIDRLRAMVLGDNHRMLNLIRSRFPRHTVHRREAGVLELEWDISRLAAAPAADAAAAPVA